MTKVGIIGAGYMADHHLKVLTAIKSVDVTSITTALDTHLKLSSTLGGTSSDTARYRVKYTDAAWIGGTATAVNGNSNLVVASGDNTFQLSVDGTASGTITLPDATYTSNGDIADALQTAINADANISGASKSVEVKWTGSAYKIISNGTSSQDISITSVDSTIEADLKLLTSNAQRTSNIKLDTMFDSNIF